MPSYRRSKTSRPRRKLVWSRLLFNVTLNSVTPGTVLDVLKPLEDDMGSSLIGCTVMRMRGHYAAQLDNTGSLDDVMHQVCIAAQPSTASIVTGGVAVADLPRISPLGTPGKHNDWMWFEPFHLTDSPSSGLWQHSGTFDVRSRRRVDELGNGVAIVAAVGSPVLVAGQSINLIGAVSTLVALP